MKPGAEQVPGFAGDVDYWLGSRCCGLGMDVNNKPRTFP